MASVPRFSIAALLRRLHVRRRFSIIKATALEILSEPLSLLILIFSLSLTVFASAFHYHQFGDPTRMARDAGLSVILLGGMPFVIFSAVRSLRREIESSTIHMVLVRPISRSSFFISKCLGAFLAYLLFLATVSLNALAVVRGAEIGAHIVANTGSIAKVWGISLLLAVSTIIVPLIIAAILNRFFSFRFVLTSIMLMPVFAVIASAYSFNPALAFRYLPVAFIAGLPQFVFLVVAASAAVRLKANQAVSLSLALLALSLPALGNYYLSETLSKGGSMEGLYAIYAIASAVPALLAALLSGIYLINSKDLT
jgi:ABC-type transport system involved in multi-copper enzyme maturation permease subunit